MDISNNSVFLLAKPHQLIKKARQKVIISVVALLVKSISIPREVRLGYDDLLTRRRNTLLFEVSNAC